MNKEKFEEEKGGLKSTRKITNKKKKKNGPELE